MEHDGQPMFSALRSFIAAFRTPVAVETRRLLRAAWDRLPARFQTSNQFLGRQYAGCGATIGAMPRCDFACRGCYLGAEANSVPAQPLAAIKQQLRQIRAWLGEGGNVQLTDGEVTLRPEAELIELIQYARAVGLVPMFMTHGDAFRRRPELLKRLVQEGGLSEVSIHIDTTQRGRLGEAYKYATDEEALLPLRDEFAALVRQVRRETGKTLEVATTFTVTRDNLAGVPAVIRWLCQNADAFKMVSFQPVSQVGRTEPGVAGSVQPDDVWSKIGEGLSGHSAKTQDYLHAHEAYGQLGHPACSRFVQGVVVRQAAEPPVFHPLLQSEDAQAQVVIHEWLERFGGLTLRLDTKWQAVARVCGVLMQAPGFMLCTVLPFSLRWPWRCDPIHPMRLVWRWLRGQVHVHYLNIISHHFMSQAEIETPLGQERLDLCAFQVPIGDTLMSMCEVNALGIRNRYYAEISTEHVQHESGLSVQATA